MTPPPAKPPPTKPSMQRSRVIQKSPVYYGWVILVAGTLGLMMTLPGQTVGVSVFLDSIIAELGLSRSAVSLMYTLGTLVASFGLPFVGRFIDRRGPRLTVILVSALFALACVWMGFVQGTLSLFIGFLLIRGLGQGSLSLVSLYVVNVWFVRRRGLAVGITGLGFAAAISVFPLLIEGLITQFGWRGAYVALGALVAATILPVGAWLFRGQPERFGLRPDSGSSVDEPPSEVNLTLAQARRTPTFWLFVAGSICVAALTTGLIFHHYSMMAQNGLDRLSAATVFVALGFIVAGANFVTGVLVDRLPPRFLLSGAMGFLVLALALGAQVTGQTTLLVYGALLGLCQGMNGALSGTVYAYYFGREHLGGIKGLATTITVAATAFGPLLFAIGFERLGSYTPVLLMSALAPLTVGLVAPFLKPPAGSGT